MLKIYGESKTSESNESPGHLQNNIIPPNYFTSSDPHHDISKQPR